MKGIAISHRLSYLLLTHHKKRYDFYRSFGDLTISMNNLQKFAESAVCLGAVLFVVSDSCLAVRRFGVVQLDQKIVMVTYYLAQLGITLSIVRNPSSKSSIKTS